jgi:hypothetical protein
MSKATYTPGPWIVSHDLGDGYSIAREVDGHNSASGKLLPVALAVFTSGNYNEPENRKIAMANAALIAAAPDLLEAAKLVVAAGKAPNILISAIAKAEGRE